MIARFLTVSAAVLFVSACAPKMPNLPFVTFAQEQAPAPAAAPADAASTTGTTTVADVSLATDTAAGAAVAGPAASPAVEPVAGGADYRIGPEDVLDVHVWKNPELSRDRVPVRPDGKLSLPLVNDIQAAGLTTEQLRAQLAERLSPFIQNPEVSVMVREIHSFKVSVSGNVNMPGQYEVKSQATVLDMLARAQGFNTFADKGSIRVVRRTGEQEQAIKFNYNDAIRGREGANFFVQRGDIIIVD